MNTPRLNKMLLIYLAFIVFFVSGCATITRSTYQRFIIRTEPEGAKVTLTSGETCLTPCNLLKKRNVIFTCLIEKEGYVSQRIHIESKIADAGVVGFAGNAAIGGIVGAGVDAYSGAALGLYPNPLVVELKEVGSEDITSVSD